MKIDFSGILAFLAIVPTRVAIVYYLILNTLTAALFVIDKKRAVNDEYRIPEATLLGLSFLGGAWGGLLAMEKVRHKTKHIRFTLGLRVFALLHLLAFAIIVFGW